ncbi:MAG: FmdB family zinc ribbon protein [Sphaerochaetaceae bacterium]
MPVYEYECDVCHHHFEVNLGFNDPRPTRCPDCQSNALHRVYGCSGVIFKGKGFYCTDKGADGCGCSCGSCSHDHH